MTEAKVWEFVVGRGLKKMNDLAKPTQRSTAERIGMTAAFKLTFATVMGVTLLSLCALLILTYIPPPPPHPSGGGVALTEAIGIFKLAFQMGFGGLTGMLAGKGM